MSKIEHTDIFEVHCKGEFDDIKRTIGNLETRQLEAAVQVAGLNSYVRNGLTHRLNAVTGLLAAVGVMLAGAIVLNIIGL